MRTSIICLAVIAAICTVGYSQSTLNFGIPSENGQTKSFGVVEQGESATLSVTVTADPGFRILSGQVSETPPEGFDVSGNKTYFVIVVDSQVPSDEYTVNFDGTYCPVGEGGEPVIYDWAVATTVPVEGEQTINVCLNAMNEDVEETDHTNIGINQDDDNMNNVIDNEEEPLEDSFEEGADGDDDLDITVTISAPEADGEDEIELSGSGLPHLYLDNKKENKAEGSYAVKDLPDMFYIEGSAVGDFDVIAELIVGEKPYPKDRAQYKVIKADIDLPGSQWTDDEEISNELEEETVGGWIVLNDDDYSPEAENSDDLPGNGVWDLVDSKELKFKDGAPQDKRIYPFDVTIDPGDRKGKLSFEWSIDHLNIYAVKDSLVTVVAPGEDFDGDKLPNFYMEGIKASETMGDVTVKARLDRAESGSPSEDTITLTVLKPDIDVDSNNDGSIEDSIDDPLETTQQAVYIAVNEDDDKGNKKQEKNKGSNNDKYDLSNMKDLIVHPVLPDGVPKGTLILSGAENVRIYNDKGKVVKPAADDKGKKPKDLWQYTKKGPCTLKMEGVTPGESKLRLTYTYTRDGEEIVVANDEVKVCVFRIEPVLYGVRTITDTPLYTGAGRRQEGRDRFILCTRVKAMLLGFRAKYAPASSKDFFKSNLRWSSTDIAGIPRRGIPEWPEDESSALGVGYVNKKDKNYIKIKYDTLNTDLLVVPQENAEFSKGGKLKMQLYDVLHNKVLDEKVCLFRTFFNKFDDSDFGSGDVAHWYHFWAKEESSRVCQYSRNKGDEAYVAHEDKKQVVDKHGNRHYIRGQYDPKDGPEGTITLYDHAATPRDYEFPQEGTPKKISKNWVHFEYHTKWASDSVNITFAHEMTHKIMWPQINGEKDSDGDGVLDSWEVAVDGMDPDKPDSFRQYFTGSMGSSVARDNEFYAWMCGAYIGSRKLADGTEEVVGKFTKNEPKEFHGKKPELSKIKNDWSTNGYNWSLEKQ